MFVVDEKFIDLLYLVFDTSTAENRKDSIFRIAAPIIFDMVPYDVDKCYTLNPQRISHQTGLVEANLRGSRKIVEVKRCSCGP